MEGAVSCMRIQICIESDDHHWLQKHSFLGKPTGEEAMEINTVTSLFSLGCVYCNTSPLAKPNQNRSP